MKGLLSRWTKKDETKSTQEIEKDLAIQEEAGSIEDLAFREKWHHEVEALYAPVDSCLQICQKGEQLLPSHSLIYDIRQ